MAARGLSCSICVDSYVDSTDICSTRCGHIYHMSCLQHWITQSNTCPICNQTQPQPHRIFLDIDVINEPSTSNVSAENGGQENVVVIKGVKPHQITSQLNTFIRQLIIIMEISIEENHIKDIKKFGNKQNLSLQVSFRTKYDKELFIKNKHKLKKNAETLEVRIHELLNAETQKLFQYSHKLKDIGYKIFFVKNDKVFAKKYQESQPMNILSKEQVDSLCAQPVNNTRSASSNVRNNSEIRSTSNDQIRSADRIIHTNRNQTSSNVRNNTEIRSTNNDQIRSANRGVETNHSQLVLYQCSQDLVQFGYEIIFENNKVYAKKTNGVNTERIIISSNAQLTSLVYEEQRWPRELYQHSYILTDYGYEITLENNKIFAKKAFCRPIIITSKDHVNRLWAKEINEIDENNERRSHMGQLMTTNGTINAQDRNKKKQPCQIM